MVGYLNGDEVVKAVSTTTVNEPTIEAPIDIYSLITLKLDELGENLSNAELQQAIQDLRNTLIADYSDEPEQLNTYLTQLSDWEASHYAFTTGEETTQYSSDNWCDYTDLFGDLESVVNLPSVTTLWSESIETLAQFWDQVVLEYFFVLPNPEVQKKVAATLTVMNSAVIPPLTPKCAVELPLPVFYLQGPAGSGKTKFLDVLRFHYPESRAAVIDPKSTGTSLRDTFHKACFKKLGRIKGADFTVDCPIYFPAMAQVDNFYYEHLGQWGKFGEYFLRTYRSQCGKDQKFQNTGDGQELVTFYTHLCKYVTTVKDIAPDTQKKEEFSSRCVKLRFRPVTSIPKNLAAYDWSELATAYKALWLPEQVKERFFPLYFEAVTLEDESLANLFSTKRLYDSYLLVAVTGVYAKIWNTLEEAIEHLAEHQKYIEITSIFQSDVLSELVTRYIKNQEDIITKHEAVDIYLEDDRIITFDQLQNYISGCTSSTYSIKKPKLLSEVNEVMSHLGWQRKLKENSGVVWQKEEEKEN